MNWKLIAFCAQLLLLGYLEVIEWINLYPWNDIRHGNGQPLVDIAIGITMLLLMLATLRTTRLGAAVAAILYGLWLLIQVINWWVPYARGASPMWQRIYSATFASTVKLLPNFGTHLAPDAAHIVLQLLIAAAIVATAKSATVRSSAIAGRQLQNV